VLFQNFCRPKASLRRSLLLFLILLPIRIGAPCLRSPSSAPVCTTSARQATPSSFVRSLDQTIFFNLIWVLSQSFQEDSSLPLKPNAPLALTPSSSYSIYSSNPFLHLILLSSAARNEVSIFSPIQAFFFFSSERLVWRHQRLN